MASFDQATIIRATTKAAQAFATELLGDGASADVQHASDAILALITAALNHDSPMQFLALLMQDYPVVLSLLKDLEAKTPPVASTPVGEPVQ